MAASPAIRSSSDTLAQAAAAGGVRLLILGPEPIRPELLASALVQHGYRSAWASAAQARETVHSHRPDVILILDTGTGAEGCALARALGADATAVDVPVVLSVGEADASTYRDCFEAGIEDLLVRPISAPVLAARLRPLHRLSTLRNELRRRHQTARKLGVSPPAARELAPDEAPYRLLAAPIDSPAYEDLLATLGPGFAVCGAETPYLASDMLVGEEFDALVLLPGTDIEAQLHLSAHIRNNTRLFDLPVLLLSPEGKPADPVQPYRRGVTTVLPERASVERLRYAILGLVRRQKMRRHVRELLRATRLEGTTDLRTGQYSAEFLRTHLHALVEDAAHWDRQLSVTLLACSNVGEIARLFGADAADSFMREIGGWISSLVRVEDTVGRFNGTGFLVALPDTGLEEAEIVGHRIAGVLLNTDFAVPGCNDPVRVWLEAGSAAWAPGDTPDGHIARARNSLR